MNLYKRNKANKKHIETNFQGASFKPRLETYIDIDNYIEKILKNAERFECWIDKDLAGFVAIYCNNIETREAFVTMVSVMSKYGGRGIAKDLINQAIQYCKKQGFMKMNLEVRKDNLKAINLYEKFGFKQFKENEKSIMMELIF